MRGYAAYEAPLMHGVLLLIDARYYGVFAPAARETIVALLLTPQNGRCISTGSRDADILMRIGEEHARRPLGFTPLPAFSLFLPTFALMTKFLPGAYAYCAEVLMRAAYRYLASARTHRHWYRGRPKFERRIYRATK